MTQETTDRRSAVGHAVDVLPEAIVEIQLAGVAQLHDRRCCERLRDRPDPVLGVGGCFPAVLVARCTYRARPDELALANDRSRNGGKPVGLALGDQTLERRRERLRLPGHPCPGPREPVVEPP